MIFLILGIASLLVLMYALGAFSRADVKDVKQFGVWTAAIGGLLFVVLLFLTGRGSLAFAALFLLGPMVWSWVAEGGRRRRRMGGRAKRASGMSREEAYAVLGLRPGAGEAEIRAAHRRLMRTSHPDAGGSDWLAARVNQARDVLLG